MLVHSVTWAVNLEQYFKLVFVVVFDFIKG